MISPSQRPVSDNTQHSQQTNIHASGGIRTHNLSRRAAKDLRPRPRGHWDRLWLLLLPYIRPLDVNGRYLSIKAASSQEKSFLYLMIRRQVHCRAGMIVVVWMEFCPFRDINSYFAVMLMLDLLWLLYTLGIWWAVIWYFERKCV